MRAIELNLDSVLFSATNEKISTTAIHSIERVSDKVKIKIGYSDYLECNPGDTVVEGKYRKYYLKLEHAQKAQLRSRQAEIQNRFNEMVKKQNEYNLLIDTWFDKPAHNPFEKEIQENEN